MEYYEVTLYAERTDDKGQDKAVKELYLFEAPNFGGAEQLAEQLKNVVDVAAITKTPYGEIINRNSGEYAYEVVVKIEFEDESGKTKNKKVAYLVEADSVDMADDLMNETLSDLKLNYSIEKVIKKNYIDIFD